MTEQDPMVTEPPEEVQDLAEDSEEEILTDLIPEEVMDKEGEIDGEIGYRDFSPTVIVMMQIMREPITIKIQEDEDKTNKGG